MKSVELIKNIRFDWNCTERPNPRYHEDEYYHHYHIHPRPRAYIEELVTYKEMARRVGKDEKYANLMRCKLANTKDLSFKDFQEFVESLNADILIVPVGEDKKLIDECWLKKLE